MDKPHPRNPPAEGKSDPGIDEEITQCLKITSSTINQPPADSEVFSFFQSERNYDVKSISARVVKEMRDSPTSCEWSHFEQDALLSKDAPIHAGAGNSIIGSTPALDEFYKTSDEGGIFSTMPPPFSIDPMLCDDHDMGEYDIGQDEAECQMGASIMSAMLNSNRQRKTKANYSYSTHCDRAGVDIDEIQFLEKGIPLQARCDGSPQHVDGENPQKDSFFTKESGRSSPQECGVCAYPPFGVPSFRMVGDTGVTRWVTALAMRRSSSYGEKRRCLEPWAPSEVNLKRGLDLDLNDHDRESHEEDGEDALSSTNTDDGERALDGIANLRQGPSSFGLLGGSTRLEDLLRQVNESTAKEQSKGLRERGEKDEGFPLPLRSIQNSSSSFQDELWVMKYASRNFREVLSDEAINLRLLRWLKSWDSYVFQGSDTNDEDEMDLASSLSSASPSLSTPDFLLSSLEGKGASGVRKKRKQPPSFPPEGKVEKSIPTPPVDRLALLVGPPGAGKTTLAHILATHAGYEVVEVNASMERTYAQLEGIIRMTVSSTGVSSSSSRLSRRQRTRMMEERKERGTHAPPPSLIGLPSSPSFSHSTSLIDQLLRPKCLIIDEMDGMATSVGQLLLNLEIRRPVFCICNDFYVNSLRELRKRCQNVFFFPPIAPQRLISRLSEISVKEGLAVDQAVLAEVVRASNGDVRSCLNTLQFIKTMPSSFSSNSNSSNNITRISTLEEIRQMQGKDAQVDVWEAWKRVFYKIDRIKAIQQLKEYGIDYEELIASVAARGHRIGNYQHQNEEEGMSICRKRSREDPRSTFEKDLSNAKVEEISTIYSKPPPAKAGLFRFDPGYIYLSCLLQKRAGGLFGGRTFLDGLQDNFLSRSYNDYTFEHTNAVVNAFSTQDLFASRAFTHNAPGGIEFASRFELVTALNCHHHCGGRQTSGGLHFPREQAQAQQLLNTSLSALRAFREGCSSLEVVNHLWGGESLAGEVCPFLLRSLFDRRLRLSSSLSFSLSSSSYSTLDLTTLPAADQGYLKEALDRHVAYGLSYQKQTHPDYYFFSFLSNNEGMRNRVRFGSAPMSNGPSSSFSSPNSLGEEGGMCSEEEWVLTPSIDHVGAFRRHFIPENRRDLNSNSKLTSNTSSIFSNGIAEARSVLPLFMTMKNDIKQMLVGEIQRHAIMLKAKGASPSLSSQQGENHLSRGSNNTGDFPNAVHGVDNNKHTAPRFLSERESAVKLTKEGEGSSSSPSPIPSKAVLDGSTSSENVASGKTLVSGVKRDFFGRIISTSSRTGSATLKGSSSATSSFFNATTASRSAPLKPPVRYVYQDGSTNAVKFPATVHDF